MITLEWKYLSDHLPLSSHCFSLDLEEPKQIINTKYTLATMGFEET